MKRAARGLALLAALVALAAFAATVSGRWSHPYELEWMEGGTLLHVQRLAAGQPLYVAPTLEWTPFFYPPGYYWACWPLARLAPGEIWPLRVTSLLGAGLALHTLYRWARLHAGALGGLVAAGAFAACYGRTGAFLDLARVDAWGIGLTTLGSFLALERRGRASAIVAAVVLAWAALTKQTFVLSSLAVALGTCLRQPRRGAALAASVAALVLTAVLLLDRRSGGWFSYYVLELPRRQASMAGAAREFFTADLGAAWPAALVLALLTLRRAPRDLLGVGCYLAACIAIALLGRVHSGAYDNALIPAYAALALVLGVGAPRALERRTELAWLLAAGQIAWLGRVWGRYRPLPEDRDSGDAAVTAIAALPPRTWIPYHPALGVAGGKPPMAHWMGVHDVLRATTRDAPADDLAREIERRVEGQEWDAIVIDARRDLDHELGPALDRAYQRRGPLFERPGLWPPSGFPTRPAWVYVPRR